ncbi:MAG: hypothetical protein KDA68_09845 [Planctomycetaceae bacterium]|nr:hypothetical protein [Planctomycetaceae bacterium]
MNREILASTANDGIRIANAVFPSFTIQAGSVVELHSPDAEATILLARILSGEETHPQLHVNKQFDPVGYPSAVPNWTPGLVSPDARRRVRTPFEYIKEEIDNLKYVVFNSAGYTIRQHKEFGQWLDATRDDGKTFVHVFGPVFTGNVFPADAFVSPKSKQIIGIRV